MVHDLAPDTFENSYKFIFTEMSKYDFDRNLC